MKQESLGKRIIKLALPATVENIFQTLVGFVDTLLIAQLGLVAVTAVGLANTILNVYLAVYMALGVGATALIARS
ncbi:MATE family efflux transporter, partial [Streptococcus suis]